MTTQQDKPTEYPVTYPGNPDSPAGTYTERCMDIAIWHNAIEGGGAWEMLGYVIEDLDDARLHLAAARQMRPHIPADRVRLVHLRWAHTITDLGE